MEELELVRHPDTNELIPEEWREVPEFKGYYEVSNYGRARSWHRKGGGRSEKPKLLKTPPNAWKYPVICLHINNTPSKKKVHRLVAELFVKNPHNKPQVNHIDGIKSNNFYLNLEWCTNSENIKHAYSIGLKSKAGERNGRSILTEDEVLEIIKIHKTGKYTQTEIGEMFCVSKHCISDIVNRKSWKHIEVEL